MTDRDGCVARRDDEERRPRSVGARLRRIPCSGHHEKALSCERDRRLPMEDQRTAWRLVDDLEDGPSGRFVNGGEQRAGPCRIGGGHKEIHPGVTTHLRGERVVNHYTLKKACLRGGMKSGSRERPGLRKGGTREKHDDECQGTDGPTRVHRGALAAIEVMAAT